MYRPLSAASLPTRYLGLGHAQRLRTAPRWLRYGVALLLFSAALVSRFELVGVLPAAGFPFLTFFPAVLLAAYLAGLGPGLATAALSVGAAWFFFVQPDRSLPLSGPDLVALGFFSAILLIDCFVIHIMMAALERVRRSEQQVRDSGHRLGLVLDNLHVYVGLLDLDGTLREVNQEALQAGEIDRGAVLGRPLWDAPWWPANAKQQHDLRAAIARAAAGETARFDVQVMRQAVPFIFDFQVGPLREGDGRITALVASGVNVSERVNALTALQSSRREAVLAAEAAEAERRVLDATFNAVPASLIVAGAGGRLLRMNQASQQIWGNASLSQDLADFASWKGWWADGSARDGQPVQPHEWGLARSLRGETCAQVVEIEPFDRPGTRLTTLLSSAPVLDPRGRVVGGVVAQVDITSLKRAEAALNAANDQLRQADQQKDEFLATLAHELRNPLAPIRTAAELIRLRDPADATVQRARAIIERQVLHLTRLVDDLLDVSRITMGTVHLRQEVLDLAAVADGALDAMRASLDAAGLALDHQASPAPVLVRGDATRLSQCIVNLLANAAKFTPRGGRIGVRVMRAGPMAGIEISDTGNGILEGNLERIFGLFVQEQTSGLHGNTGLGIGLALTRKLVALHGGTVSAASPGPGRGSTFRIELPAASAAHHQPAESVPAPPSPQAGARVLLVEDNRDAAELLAELLEMTGFSVTVASTGQAALQAMAQDAPDAVLMDIGLPDLNGYEVCRRIRQLDSIRQPVMVALTGWGSADDLDRAREAGFNDHLTKPAEPDRIVALLQELIDAAGGPGRTDAALSIG